MKKALTYVAGAAVTAIVAMAANPSNAAPITANGTFGFTTQGGTVTLNTPNIAAGTTSKTVTNLVVNTFDPTFLGNPNNLGTAGVAVGTPVTIASFPITTVTGPANFLVDVGGLIFTFTDAISKSLVPSTGNSAGVLGTQYNGSLTGSTGGTFNTGTPAILAENCNQPQTGATINCSDTLSVAQGLVTAPEPGSLALLGSALVGFGLYRRRRRTAA